MKRKRARKSKSTAKRWKSPHSMEQYAALGNDSQETWNRVVHAISRMRSEKISLRRASMETGISPRKVVSLGRSALRKDSRGRYRAKRTDHLLRVLIIPAPDGLREVAVKDSSTASAIATYSDAVQKYLRTGEYSSALLRFSWVSLKDAEGNPISFLTDKRILNRLGSAGVLSFESLYARVG
jgi:hypothetical protein